MESSMKERFEEIIKAKRTIKAELAQEVKGGYRLKFLDDEFKGVNAFMPYSQGSHYGTKLVDVAYVLHVHVVEINEKYPDSVVVSGMAHLKRWIYQQEQEFISNLEIGQQVHGEVVDIKDYGVFVDLGPMTGLLHSSKIPAEFKGQFRKGDTANLAVDTIDTTSHRIGLKCREKKFSPSRMFRKIMGRQKGHQDEKGINYETVEASELRRLLMAMTVEEVEEILPKLRRRADWQVRNILKGKYNWFAEIKEVV